MRAVHKNILRTLLMVLIVGALFYVFFSVFKEKVDMKKERNKITQMTDAVLDYQRNCDRMQCDSIIYLRYEDADGVMQYVPDDTFHQVTILDNHNQLMERKDKTRTEIFKFKSNGDAVVYSMGVSLISEKGSYTLQRIRPDQWSRYICENIYCQQTKEGKDNFFSSGFLADTGKIKRIESYGVEDLNGVACQKYSFEVVNTLYGNKGEKEEMGYRKLLNRKGVDYLRFKKGYKDAYKLLKDKYDANTEKIFVWVDEQGALRQIEKDYTIDYYAEIMQENSEVIKNKVGQYGYPEVISRQTYTYNPECARIQIPL